MDFLVDGHPVLADEYEVSVKTSENEEVILKESIEFELGAFHTSVFVGLNDDLEFRLLTDGTNEK